MKWMRSSFLFLIVAQAAAAVAAAQGIPVTDALTRQKCGSCHAADSEGRLSRISYIRTTPEGWEMIIRRMMRLNDLDLAPEDVRPIMKYLSSNHGLSPEEARAGFYESERRMVREQIPDETLGRTCMVCHSLGRILSQRRNRDEWQLLADMHMAMFPGVELNYFRSIQNPAVPVAAPTLDDPRRILSVDRPGPIQSMIPAADAKSNARDNLDRVLDYLERNQPLDTPEYNAWRANFRQPLMTGNWSVEAYMTGKGRGYGQMTVRAGPVADEFETATTMVFADGARVEMKGRAILYAGYTWRGRTGSPEAAGTFKELREVMLLDAKSATMRGRWYTGAYDEIGVDVVLRRIGSDIQISGTDKPRLLAGKADEVKVYGANFPADLKASEIDFGPGIQVTGLRVAPTMLTLQVNAAPGAPVGYRDATIRGRTAPRVLAVFNTIDYLRVLPEHGMARLGGVTYPKGFQQFEAVAYNAGPDKRPGTADDVELGAVPVRWSLEEFNATLNDDDIQFVGAIDPDSGFFTPNIEGPNPERSQNGNNYGDVQVVATYAGEGTAKPLSSKSMLIVTVPLYAIWAQRGVMP